MKKGLRIFLTIAMAAFVFGTATSAFGQRLGGYKSIATTDAGVQEAASFAAETQGEKVERTISVVSVNKAEVQVVAGKNYRICMKVESSSGQDESDSTFWVQTVVYVDLKGNHKLTSWTPTDCGEDEEGD